MTVQVQDKILTSRKRLFVVFAVLAGLFILLVGRVAYWSIIRGEDLEREAQNQWISDTVVAAQRGSILDRSGNVLAQSAGADTVVLMPQEVKDPEAVAKTLSEVLDMDRTDLLRKASTTERLDADGSSHKIVELWIKRQISAEQSEAIEKADLAGVKLISDVQRYYPNRSFAAQVIGYTSLDGDGQSGIERRFNAVLEGRPGRTIAETDRLNNDIPNGDEMIIEPVDGQSVVLTLNEVIQSFMEDACQEALETLNADSVQGTVLDIPSREILAMANSPSFDLNDPPRSDGEELARESTNVVTARAFEPGTLFAIFTAAAAYDSENVRSSYICNGTATIDGMELTCPGVHGTQSYDEAVENQCLVAAGYMAADMGMQEFYRYLENFGFGSPTGIEFTSDNAGSVMEMKYATEAEIARMGAGASLKVTQLQIADALAALLDNGALKSPQLVRELRDTTGETTESYKTSWLASAVSEESAEKIEDLLVEMGKSKDALITGYAAGGISGVALQPQDSLEDEGSASVNIYAAFAPASNPRYLILMAANGETETVSDENALEPYVSEVLEKTLEFAGVQPQRTGPVAASTAPEAEPTGRVSVPRLVGLDLASALERAELEGLEIQAGGTGTVIGQYPYAGTEVELGSAVQLEMSMREESAAEGIELPGGQTTVPNFTGMTFEEAMDKAMSSGLTFLAQGTGVAVSQTPVAGAAVERGTTVTVTFRIDVN